MRNRTRFFRLFSIMLVLCMSLTGLVFAGEDAPEAAPEPETVVAAPLQLKAIGQESEDAFQIKITNNTGKNIDYVGIHFYDPDPAAYSIPYRMQKALIEAGYLEGEADGSVGPMTQDAIAAFREANGLPAEGGADEQMLEKLLGAGYDGNVMTAGDVFTAGETRNLFIPRTKPAEESAPAEEQETVEEAAEAEVPQTDALAEMLKEYALSPEYVISFRGQGETDLYYLFAFPASAMQTAQLNLDGQIPYIMYTTSASPEPISTLDAEKKASDLMYSGGVLSAAAGSSLEQTMNENADTGYDQGYDTVYEEPVYDDARYVVTEEYYPNCDDGSHGVIYRVWSDGTEERIEY